MKNLSREQIRKIVLKEQELAKKMSQLEGTDETGMIQSRLGTLELLTREDIYNASPVDTQKLIEDNFQELVGINSMISMSATLALQAASSEEEIEALDEEDKKGLEIIKEFVSFIAENPDAAGLEEEDKDIFKLMKEGIMGGNPLMIDEAKNEFMKSVMKGVHSCVDVHVESVDEGAGEVVFDFSTEADQDEFTSYLGIPKKDASMVRIKNCNFGENYPKAGEDYSLNIVELDDLPFEEETDSYVIGIVLDGTDLEGYSPFYDKGGDGPEEYDFNVVVVINGIPSMYASDGGPIPAIYLWEDGSVNIDVLDNVEGAIGYLPEINTEDEIEVNVPYIEKRLEGQQFATVDTYERTFVETAKLGLVVYDRDTEDPSKYVWIARPKNYADLEKLSKHTFKVDQTAGELVESFKISDTGEVIL